MKTVEIWMCVDLDDPEQSGFGKTREQAEEVVARNRGYGYNVAQLLADGWCESARLVEVPWPVARVLLAGCESGGDR